ncbi:MULTISPECIES: response regulator [Clostridium]|jgi:DNA-binding NtrC family response regulator|uniref:Stage 0 sporulation protein A homolog n=1 Tax=Clostridium intestinale DSM 6191 TaxID=1121320 RepID=A0A1M5X0Q8_9CLOT|nr:MULTISPECIES: response regulator [Clostridium]WRY51845.1 response regulator [Clostridium intestinale]SHH93024.1 TPR repeat-containing protein [Clostridium intestinale DSM 6191]
MKKILVVDDTKNIREMLKTFLEMEGFTVFEAKNAEEALNIFNTENIDLIFTDIKLPNVSGTELLKQIKKNNRFVTIIVMTAFGTIKNAVECTKYGAAAYLQKPFTTKRVKAVLEEVLRKDTLKKDLNSYITLAKKLIEEEDYPKAEEVLNKALTIDNQNWEIYHLIGRISELQENEEKAKKFYYMSDILKQG